MSRLEAARALAAQGFAIFPIAAGKKAPPVWKNWPERAAPDASWWEISPQDNIGIHCKGLLVVDVDPKKGGDGLFELLRLTEDWPSTRAARTPSGGRHHYYRLPDSHPGVPNGVDVLGPGLDIRSTGGYVVAPGSVVGDTAYAFENEEGVAPAPSWLLDRLGHGGIKSKPAQDPHAVPDAAEEVVARATAWLRTAERSVKGQGGDQTAYRVACGLRDMGVSYAQACELMRSDAWDLGCGWREGWLEAKPIRSAYKYAENEPGSRVALPSDFPVLETGTIVPKKRTSALRLSDFAGQKATGAGYVIKGFLQRASYAEVYGAPGEGKTFTTLDMEYHVAAGREWMGHKVTQGPTLHLAFEGRGGLIARARALRQCYGDEDVPLYVCAANFSITTPEGRHELGRVMAEMPAKPVLIVFDTLAKALMGGDENSAQDVGAFNLAVEALIENTGACVLIVHHSGKDPSKGARGSSALLAALDTEVEVAAGQIRATKQRDVELGPPIGFKLKPVVVGIDEDGDEITSCVVEPAMALPAGRKLTGNARRGFDILCLISPQNDPVHLEDWRVACVKEEVCRARSSFHEMKRALVSKEFIDIDSAGKVTRRMT